MNKIFRKAIVLALAGSALLYVGCTKDYSGDIQTLRNEFEQYKSETNTQINTLNGQLSGLRTSVSALEKAKEQTELAIDQLKNRATALETFKQNAEAQFASLEGQISGINSEISAINGRLGQIDGQIAGIYANISDLQKADEELAAAIELAKARIQALEDNTYTKQEVDGKIKDVNDKIDAAKAWAEQTFATKELVATIDGKLAALTGVVGAIDNRLSSVETDLNNLTNAFNDLVAVVNALGGDVDAIKGKITDILNEIENIKNDIKGVKEQLATVKETADTALEKANQALTETQAIRDDLATNYYKAEKVDALLSSLKNSLEAQINTEVANRIAGDEKANERIDSLAKVTKAIEEDLANFKTETSEKLLELENKINEEITNRVAFQTAQEVKNAALDQKDAALEAAIAAIDAAYKAADKALNDRCDALADRCFALEGRATELENKLGALREEFNSFKTETQNALSGLRDDLNTEIQNRQDADLAINQRIDALQNDLNDKYTEIKGEIADICGAIDELDLRISIAYLYIDYLLATSERVQSLVFLPEYNDFLATANYIVYGGDTLMTVVKATYEVKPVEALGYVLNNVDSLALAARELLSRADVDDVFTDIVLDGSDEVAGRFTIKAYVPEILHEDISAVSLIFGNYEVENCGLSGNSIQSTYVGLYFDEAVNLSRRYTWYNETEEAVYEADTIKCIDHVAYTAPIKEEKPRICFADYSVRMKDVDGEYLTPAKMEKKYHLTEGTLSDFNYTLDWTVFGVNGYRVEDKTPFNFDKDVPETEFFTDYIVSNDNDTIIDKMYVGDTTRHIQTLCRGNEVLRLVALAQFDVTKNIIPGYKPEQRDTIRWSYIYYDPQEDTSYVSPSKSFNVVDPVLNATQRSAATAFTHNGSAFTITHNESMAIASGKTIYEKWYFESDPVKYVSLGWEFETDSDIYTDVEIPFVVLPQAKDRTAKINLEEIGYTPTYGYNIEAEQIESFDIIEPGFNGEEDYFIGDAEGDAGTKAALYNAFVGTPDDRPFVIDGYQLGVKVMGEEGEKVAWGQIIKVDETQECPFEINVLYNSEDDVDLSYLTIEPASLGFGQYVLIYGHIDAFGVTFSYEIQFKTPELPFKLVLTPYTSPKDVVLTKYLEKEGLVAAKTIIALGDDKFDADGEETSVDANRRYNIQQMFYTKYLQVQNNEGVPSNCGEDLEVRFTFTYEDLSEFGFVVDDETTPDEKALFEAQRGFLGGVTDVVDVLDGALAGYLDQQAILTWGTYQGRLLKVKAVLYDNGMELPVSEDFNIWTIKPIEVKDNLAIGSNEDPLIRTSGEPIDIRPAEALIVGGVLSRDADYEPYYVADPSVFGYNDNNVRQKGIRRNQGSIIFPNYVYYPAGEFHPFYGYLYNDGEGDVERKVSEVIFDYDAITATLNEEPWDLTNGGDWQVTTDEYGEIFTLLKDSGQANIVITIPVKFRYYLDYCGAKPEEGSVTIYIKQI